MSGNGGEDRMGGGLPQPAMTPQLLSQLVVGAAGGGTPVGSSRCGLGLTSACWIWRLRCSRQKRLCVEYIPCNVSIDADLTAALRELQKWDA